MAEVEVVRVFIELVVGEEKGILKIKKKIMMCENKRKRKFLMHLAVIHIDFLTQLLNIQ